MPRAMAVQRPGSPTSVRSSLAVFIVALAPCGAPHTMCSILAAAKPREVTWRAAPEREPADAFRAIIHNAMDSTIRRAVGSASKTESPDHPEVKWPKVDPRLSEDADMFSRLPPACFRDEKRGENTKARTTYTWTVRDYGESKAADFMVVAPNPGAGASREAYVKFMKRHGIAQARGGGHSLAGVCQYLSQFRTGWRAFIRVLCRSGDEVILFDAKTQRIDGRNVAVSFASTQVTVVLVPPITMQQDQVESGVNEFNFLIGEARRSVLSQAPVVRDALTVSLATAAKDVVATASLPSSATPAGVWLQGRKMSDFVVHVRYAYLGKGAKLQPGRGEAWHQAAMKALITKLRGSLDQLTPLDVLVAAAVCGYNPPNGSQGQQRKALARDAAKRDDTRRRMLERLALINGTEMTSAHQALLGTVKACHQNRRLQISVERLGALNSSEEDFVCKVRDRLRVTSLPVDKVNQPAPEMDVSLYVKLSAGTCRLDWLVEEFATMTAVKMAILMAMDKIRDSLITAGIPRAYLPRFEVTYWKQATWAAPVLTKQSVTAAKMSTVKIFVPNFASNTNLVTRLEFWTAVAGAIRNSIQSLSLTSVSRQRIGDLLFGILCWVVAGDEAVPTPIHGHALVCDTVYPAPPLVPHEGDVKLAVYSLTDRWGRKFGGIPVFNMELCYALAQFRTVQVNCLTVEVDQTAGKAFADMVKLSLIPTPGDMTILKPTATHNKSTILPAVARVAADKIAELRELSAACSNVLVIGHDKFTGSLAIEVTRLLRTKFQPAAASNGSKAPMVVSMVFKHMSDDLGAAKLGHQLQSNPDNLDAVLAEADSVGGVGQAFYEQAGLGCSMWKFIPGTSSFVSDADHAWPGLSEVRSSDKARTLTTVHVIGTTAMAEAFCKRNKEKNPAMNWVHLKGLSVPRTCACLVILRDPASATPKDQRLASKAIHRGIPVVLPAAAALARSLAALRPVLQWPLRDHLYNWSHETEATIHNASKKVETWQQRQSPAYRLPIRKHSKPVKNRIRLLCFGRLTDFNKHAGVALMIALRLQEIVPQNQSVKITLVGLDGHKQSFKLRNVKVILKPFTVNTATITEEVCNADVLLVPSGSEAMALTAIEAISCAIPCVVTGDSGFQREFEHISALVPNGTLLQSCTRSIAASTQHAFIPLQRESSVTPSNGVTNERVRKWLGRVAQYGRGDEVKDDEEKMNIRDVKACVDEWAQCVKALAGRYKERQVSRELFSHVREAWGSWQEKAAQVVDEAKKALDERRMQDAEEQAANALESPDE